jgi:Uma2 family endonuclease
MTPSRPEPRAASAARPLPLEAGDHLTRAEFERRYEACPDLKKAELVEGVVYVPSPVRLDVHAAPHGLISAWLCVYEGRTPGVVMGDNATVRLDLDNEPQPDALLRIVRGGQSRLSEDGYVEGAPEAVVEITASTASYDLHAKLRAYRRNGVREYVVWRVRDEALDWLVLEAGAYVPLPPAIDGTLRSRVFPGLWLDPPALLRRDIPRVLAVLEEGLKSPEHAAFVDLLASRT